MSLEDVVGFFHANRDARYAVAGHQRPDGDALGAALGLASMMRSAGYQARAVNLSSVPRRLRFLLPPGSADEAPAPDWVDGYDCLVMVDCGEWDRLDPVNRLARDRLKVVTLDHHDSGRGVGDAVWIDPKASSMGEMMVRLSLQAGWGIPADAAMALWVAIVTDTGRFSFENTSVVAVEAARICLVHGARPDLAARHLYDSCAPEERALQARVLGRIEYHEGGRLAVSGLNRQDFLDAACDVEGTQDLVNLLRDTAGVEAAVFLYELPDSGRDAKVKASIRTMDPHDAVKVAERFGGGGHRRAAACVIDLPFDAAKRACVDAARRAYFGRADDPAAART